MKIRLFTMVCFVVISAGNIFAQTNAISTNYGDVIEGFTNTPMLPGGKWHQHDPNRPQPPVVTPGDTGRTSLLPGKFRTVMWK
jgi:hypothetical protein